MMYLKEEKLKDSIIYQRKKLKFKTKMQIMVYNLTSATIRIFTRFI